MARLLRHERCEQCGSSDGKAVYADGSTHCWSAKHEGRRDTQPNQEPENDLSLENLDEIAKLPHASLTQRGIGQAVAEQYGVRVEYDANGGEAAYYFPLFKQGQLVGYQRKAAKAPGQRAKHDTDRVGETKGCEPFGAHITGNKGKFIIVTEGAEDCLAASQMLQSVGKKYRVVSTLGADGWQRQLEFFQGYEKVVIAYDQDVGGKKGAEAFAAALRPGQAFTMAWNPNYADPNELLTAGCEAEFLDALNKANEFKPDGIVAASDTWDLYKAKKEQVYIPYPEEWASLRKKCYGLRMGEISMWTSGTGMGKSSLMRELQLHILKTTKERIGVIALEEGVGDTVQGLMELVLEKRISLPDVPVTPDEERKAWEKLCKNDRLFFVKHEGSLEDDSVISKMRYLIHGLGCTVVFLDHITIAVSEMADGHSGQDKFMNEMLKLVKSKPVHIAVVSHLRKSTAGSKSFEEGAIPTDDDLKGSGSLKQISFDIIALSRNKMAENEVERNICHIHVLKCRKTGRTGSADRLFYNDLTGRLIVRKDEPLPADGVDPSGKSGDM